MTTSVQANYNKAMGRDPLVEQTTEILQQLNTEEKKEFLAFAVFLLWSIGGTREPECTPREYMMMLVRGARESLRVHPFRIFSLLARGLRYMIFPREVDPKGG
jgi:hypothetical protein